MNPPLNFLRRSNSRPYIPSVLFHKYHDNGMIRFEAIPTNNKRSVPFVVRKRRERNKLTKDNIPFGLILFYVFSVVRFLHTAVGMRCSSRLEYGKKIIAAIAMIFMEQYTMVILPLFFYLFSFPNLLIKYPLIVQAAFPFLFIYFAVRSADKIRPVYFFLGSIVVNIFLYSWLSHTIHYFGGLNIVLSLLAVILLSAYLALYNLLFIVLLRRFSKLKYILAPLFWLVLELIRGSFISGFPFNHLGYALFRVPFLILPARFFTVYGVGVFIVALASAAAMKHKRKWVIMGCLLLIYFSPLGFFNWKAPSPGLRIAALQTSFEPEDKRTDDLTVFLDYHLSPTEAFLSEQEMDAVVWSETSFPFVLNEYSYEFRKVSLLSSVNSTAVIFGALTRSQENYYNSSVHINISGDVAGIYSKNHLVPFGEYFPMKNWPVFKSLYGQYQNFAPSEQINSFIINGVSVYTPICYEIGFGGLVRSASMKGSKVIANISNDGWYGYSAGPVSGISTSVFRAVESNVWVIRAINRGWGVIVDPFGRILEISSPDKWGFLVLDHDGSTDFIEIEPPKVAVKSYSP